MSRLASLRIGHRLWLGFGALCAIIALVAGVILVEAQGVRAASDRMIGFRMPVAQTSAGLEGDMYASLAALRGYLLTGNDSFRQERAESWVQIDANIATMDKLAAGFTNPANARIWTEARDLVPALKAAQAKAEALGPGKEAVEVLVGEAVPKVRRLVALLAGEKGGDGRRAGGMIDDQRRMLDADAAAVDQMMDTMVAVVVGALVLGLLAGMLIARGTAAGIVPPLVAMTRAMAGLSAGDTSVEIPAAGRQDEVGEMAEAMVVFRANLIRQLELEAAQRAADEAQRLRAARIEALTGEFDAAASQMVQLVASAANQLSATAGQMSATAAQTSHQATTVAAASEEASVNVQTVAAAAEELSSSIHEIGRQVAHSREISHNAVDQATQAGGAVDELAATVTRIGEVVTLINDIASQTNLLALNATIEAARAGEAGKGFAVVAGEVKTLANQTARATGEIGQQIAAIQDQTHRVVETIGTIVAVIEEIGHIAADVADAVDAQSAATSEIARNVEQAALGTSEVSGNVVQVQAAADQTGTSSREVLDASKILAEQSSRLRGTIVGFLDNVRTA